MPAGATVPAGSLAAASAAATAAGVGVSGEFFLAGGVTSGSDQSEEGKLGLVLTQWEVLINMVNKLGSGLRHLKSTVGEDLVESDHKLLTVDASLGRKPRDCGFEDCASAWDGLALMASQVKELGKDQVLTKDNIQTALESIGGGRVC